MTNFNISKTDNNTYVVRGDSERFGKNAILFESYKKSDCDKYVMENNPNVIHVVGEEESVFSPY